MIRIIILFPSLKLKTEAVFDFSGDQSVYIDEPNLLLANRMRNNTTIAFIYLSISWVKNYALYRSQFRPLKNLIEVFNSLNRFKNNPLESFLLLEIMLFPLSFGFCNLPFCPDIFIRNIY